MRSGMLVYGDAAQTAHNIVASEHLFRIGIATDLFGGACNAVLAVAFYTMLKQVNSPLALLAAFWRLGEAVILGHMTLNGMTVLNILRPASLSGFFSPGQVQALASLYVGAQGDEFSIGLVYYSLGSMLFCYLLLKSRYVPRILAWWGSLSSIYPPPGKWLRASLRASNCSFVPNGPNSLTGSSGRCMAAHPIFPANILARTCRWQCCSSSSQ